MSILQQALLAVGAITMPAATFYLPLQTTLVPTTAAGSATPTLTRNTGVKCPDWENVLRYAPPESPPFVGARQAWNLITTKSEDWTHASWTKTIGTVTATTLTATGANQTVLQTPVTGAAPYSLRVRMSRITGTGNIQLTLDNVTWTTVTLTGSPQVFAISQTTSGNPTIGIRIVTSGDAINADQIMLESILGCSNTNPSEYVSMGVLSAPFHGAGIDGLKYFDTLKANTVASNVVTEATGAALTPANGASSYTCDANGPFGYLQEESRTNKILRSADLTHAAWVLYNATRTANQTAGPEGDVTALKLKETSANNAHGFYQTFTATAVQWTASVYLKQAERTWAFLELTATSDLGAYFDLANGVVGTVSPGYTATITPAANGFYRCSVTTTATAASWNIILFTATADNATLYFTGTTGNGIYVWGPQVEVGAYPSSLVNTTTVEVTKTLGRLTYSFASNATATVGTAYAELKTIWATASGSYPAITFAAVATGPLYNATEASTIIRAHDGTNNVSKTGLADMYTGVRKRWATWTGSTLTVGGDSAASASGTFDGNMGSTAIGIGVQTSGGSAAWNGCIRKVRIFAEALSDAQAQTL